MLEKNLLGRGDNVVVFVVTTLTINSVSVKYISVLFPLLKRQNDQEYQIKNKKI